MNLRRRTLLAVLGLAVGLAVGLAGGSTDAWASVAANARITNSASMTYDDGTGTKTATASPVTVIVSLVQSGVTIVAGANQTTQYAGPNTPLTDTFTVTSTANGPDNYTFTPGITGSGNATSPGVGAASVIALGASVTTVGSTSTVLNVPSDGTSNGAVNGIGVGTAVVVGGQVRTVSAVTDPASGTATITLSAALSSAPAAGTGVFEEKTVSVSVLSGTIQTAGTDITVSVNAVVTNGSYTVTSATVTNTYTSGLATLAKLVRNVTDATATGTGALSVTVNGTAHTYYTGSVPAKPGEVLEYVLVAANGGAGSVSAATITDILPSDFVTFRLGAYGGVDQDVIYADESALESKLSSAADTDAATLAIATLTVYVGTGATSTGGGTIGAAGSVMVAYQVTINP